MKHFSHFIKPSAKFLDEVSDENCLAFLNPGNEIIIICYNEKEVPVAKTFKTGDIKFNVELQKKSLNTFVINATAKIENLMVEYSRNPIGMDIKNPRFSWQMMAPYNERDYSQTAYQVVVKDPGGAVMWDSKKVLSDESVSILYAGSPLHATTKYDWSAVVWDQNGITASGSSWFETGLMNPDPGLSAWDGRSNGIFTVVNPS